MLNWKVSTDTMLSIDLTEYGLYNIQDSLSIKYQYYDDTTLSDYDCDFKEIIEDIDDLTIHASNDSSNDKVYVDDVSNVKIGMRFKVKDKDIYFYVEDIDTDNNIIITRHTLTNTIKSGDEINRVGNTAIYVTSMSFDKVGNVLITLVSYKYRINFNSVIINVEENINNLLESMYKKFLKALEAFRKTTTYVSYMLLKQNNIGK